MNIADFNDKYLPDTKMKVTCRDSDNNTGSGLLLDRYFYSLADIPHVYVDSFSNRIPLADILRLESLNATWI